MKAFIAMAALVLLAGCHGGAPETPEGFTSPSDMKMIDDPESWAIINATLGRAGLFANSVFTVTIPRDDLNVTTDGDPIPTAAGIETTFYFFKCSCGKLRLTGRFVTADYEANDVISELQTDGMIKVSSLSPMLMREKPRLLVIQFQGEGEPRKLATVLKNALNYTGEARMAPQKLPQP